MDLNKTDWKWIDNPLIDEQRMPGKNIKIIDGIDSDSNLYVVYCSSNGIYFPNDKRTFIKRIIEQDKYDWKTNTINGSVCKHIYIRDILKQWYVEGINTEINTIGKVADHIRSIAKKDAKFVFVGSSAGGYMAICLGSILGGTVFAGSPQINLKLESKYSVLLVHKNDREYRRWFELKDLMLSSHPQGGVEYYILYGGKNIEDEKQINPISQIENVYTIKFNTDLHGVVFYPFNLRNFYIQKNKLLEISKQQKMISRIGFSFCVSGYKQTAIECAKRLKSGIKK